MSTPLLSIPTHAELAPHWHEAWAAIPASIHGDLPDHTCALTCHGDEVIVLARSHPAVHRYDRHGRLLASWGHPQLRDGHGLTLVTGAGESTLWITDRSSGLVGEFSLDGQLLRTLERPDHPAYAARPFKPTWVAVAPASGELWVADGYGANLLHRHAADGHHLATYDGTADPGLPAYGCPHGIAFRPARDGGVPELWLTDRNPGRIRIYTPDGVFLRVIEGVEHWPCSFAFRDELVAVPCLKTGITLLRGDRVVAHLGVNDWARAGWPAETRPADAETPVPGRFHAPHGACFDVEGGLLVAELKGGGRLVRIAPAAFAPYFNPPKHP